MKRVLALVFLDSIAAGAIAYAFLQPRGFAIGSRSFFEHQVLVPLFAVVAVAAAVAAHRRSRLTAPLACIVAGFWISASATAVLGNTTPARLMIFPLLAAASGAAFAVRFAERRAPPLVGGTLGVLLGGAFLYCAWAPPPSTRPLNQPLTILTPTAGDAVLVADDLRVEIADRQVLILGPGSAVVVEPFPRFDAVSTRGFWTLFDGGTREMDLLTTARAGDNALYIHARGPGMMGDAVVTAGPEGVTIRVVTALLEEVAVHLAGDVVVSIPGEATVDAFPLFSGDFVAFREGAGLHVLRPSSAEKGPFTPRHVLMDHDPLVRASGWTICVSGWAAQASRVESPTAGWGVSQGAIEYYDGVFIWSLAATSIGRGWHTVRRAPGIYGFEITITR